MNVQTKETQRNLTSRDAHRLLEEGNRRFVRNQKLQRNLREQVRATSGGQYPFAAVLSCIDSRVPAELVFDQGIGDIFSIRVAGNIVNEDVLGSMEYACEVAGSKIVVVLGHTKCGAVNAACNDVRMGNVTTLLDKLKPAVESVRKGRETLGEEAVEEVAVRNVEHSIGLIRRKSEILAGLEQAGHIEIVGALYDVCSGEIDFFENSLPEKLN